MRKLSLFFFAIVLSAVSAWGQTFLTEKVFLAPVETSVQTGDTVQVIGQLLSSDFTDFYSYSRYVYLEMLNGNDRIVARQKLKCDSIGSFVATIPVGSDIGKGLFFLRAYTEFMRNRPMQYYPTVPLLVGVSASDCSQNTDVQARFFPEGGHLVEGAAQRVAVCLYRGLYDPMETAFQVLNQHGDTVARGKTSRSGWASFVVPVRKAESYTLSLGSGQRFDLPAAVIAPTFHAILRGGKFLCQVLSPEGTAADGLNLFIYHPSFGLQQMRVANGKAVADVSGCTQGVLSVWLTDSAGYTVSQGALWLQGTADNQPTVSVAEQCMAGAKDFLSLSDTVAGTKAFVRIVPEGETLSPHAFDALNFQGELWSPVPFPKHYYEDGVATQKSDLDSWLLSASPSLFEPRQLTADSLDYPFAIEKSLMLSGKITKPNGKPAAQTNLQIYNVENGDAVLAQADSVGRFGAFMQDYAEGTNLYVQLSDGKRATDDYRIDLDEPTKPLTSNPSPYRRLFQGAAAAAASLPTSNLTDSIHELQGYTVKAQKKQKDLGHAMSPTPFINYFGYKDIRRHGFTTIERIIQNLDKVCIVWGSTRPRGMDDGRVGGKMVTWQNASRYRTLTTASHGLWLDFVVDGVKIDTDFDGILSQGAGGIEYIEVVFPSDRRSKIYNCPLGYIEIRHRETMDSRDIHSDGECVQPLGLTLPLKPYEVKAPTQPGRYKVLIDLVSPDRTVRSFERQLEIVP